MFMSAALVCPLSSRLRFGVVLGVVLGAVASPAAAQNALGDGQALDANSRVGGGGRNVPSLVEDFRARNRVVTGEVGDGREFRGEVGYVGERAFTAPLPSDTFFRFRADSAASSVMNVLSGVSLDRFNLAASGGVFGFDRDFTPQRPGELAPRAQRDSVADRVDLDVASRSSGVGRILERTATTSMVGQVFDESGVLLAVLGGPVTGLRYETMPTGLLPRTDVPLMDVRTMVAELNSMTPGALVPGTHFRSPLALRSGSDFADLRLHADTDADPSQRDPMRIEPERERVTGDPDYDAIVRRVVEQYGLDPTVTFTGDGAMLESLRRQLDVLRDRLERHSADPTEIRSLRERLDEAAQPTEPAAVPAAEPGAGAEPPDADAVAISEQFLRALRHGRTVEDLTPIERTHFADLIGRGESALVEGQFMLAERHFDRALRLVPKHPMGLAGIVNTQIGAGLYLSAAINLRQLFTAHPEMIDTRYGSRILPPPDRIEIGTEGLRRRIAGAARADRADYGLLLAYLGHQTADRDLVLAGVDAMRGSESDTTLVSLLESIWLAE